MVQESVQASTKWLVFPLVTMLFEPGNLDSAIEDQQTIRKQVKSTSLVNDEYVPLVWKWLSSKNLTFERSTVRSQFKYVA